MKRFAALESQSTLEPFLEDAERDHALYTDICTELGGGQHNDYWPWVLHYLFDWTARDIAFWQSEFSTRNCSCSEADSNYLCARCWRLYEQFEVEEREVEQQIERFEMAPITDPNFKPVTQTDLVYLYFHFWHFEPCYRAQVAAQTELVRTVCGAEFFEGLLSHLGWSSTEFTEALLEARGRHA